MATATLQNEPALQQAVHFIADQSRVRRLRTMREFAEAEIVLPSGPFQDQRLKIDRQPWLGLWLDEVDSGRWRRFNLTGCGQAGKTLAGSALPVIYHLFECRETVVYGGPTLDMAADKWREDVLPIIAASRYRDLLPTGGQGSKGGTPRAIKFKHGPTLRFMTGGGADKVRAGFTARVAVITETDGLDESGETSREADKVSQIEARTAAYGDRARVYLECTTSTEAGRTWRELKAGTDSKIVLKCRHCSAWVSPEREHLTGWQDCKDITEAREKSVLCCPACGVHWTEQDRTEANRAAKLIHKGQEITPGGTITGMLPRTSTLGFRFNAINNLLVSMARVAEEEFNAPRTTEPDLAERKLRQFFWTLPSEPEKVTLSEMDATAITSRIIDVPRGRVPKNCKKITVGIDVGKWLHHWVAVAWMDGGTPHVIEYGRCDVPSQQMAEEHAILNALRRFRDEVCNVGWPQIDGGENLRPGLCIVDSGNWESTIVAFTKESGAAFFPSKGFGIQQLGRRHILHDPGYEVVQQPGGHRLVEINADYWKSYVHARIQTPIGQPGALTLFHSTPTEHLSFAKHMTAEKRVEEFIAGKGLISRWEKINRNNHYLDAFALACVAGHGVGERMIKAPAPPPPPAPAQQQQPQERPDYPKFPREFPRWLSNR